MPVPFCSTYGCFSIKTGTYSCLGAPKGGCIIIPSDPTLNFLFTRALLAVRVAIHGALIFVPVLAAFWVWSARQQLQDAGCNSVGLILASMPLFTLASFAEVAQHILDGWVFLGLMPSVYNAVFYGMLSLGQAVLTLGAQYGRGAPVEFAPFKQLGVRWYDLHAAFDISVSLAAFGGLIAAWVSCSGGPEGAAFWADCYGTHFFTSVKGTLFSVWFLAFIIALLSTVSAFFIRTHCDPAYRTGLTAASAVFFVLGMAGVTLVVTTGCQVLHAVGASGFLLGFLLQLLYLNHLVAPAKARSHAD
jgi:hypothetical protein